MGRYVYVAAGSKGFDAVVTAEHDEPEAVIGSDLQRMAYPDDFRKHVERKRELTTAYRHEGNVLDVQLRGEYAYAAMGAGGFRIFDVANIDNKGFSERMVTAPVSPLGQRLYVKTQYRHGRGDSDDAGGRSAAHAGSRKRRAENSSDVRLSLRHGQIRRAGRRRQSRSEGQKSRRRHAARRKSAE